jgi:hypothetical protein
MAATVQIHEMTASQTGYDRTSQQIRFYSTDSTATNAVTNPITIPAAASDWSYTKQLRFYIGATGPSNFIASLQFYSDGTLWGGPTASYVLVEYDKQGATWGANVDASIVGTSISTKTSGSPATMCPETATYSTTTTYHGALLRLQMEVGNEASPGTLGNETITFSYDEQ